MDGPGLTINISAARISRAPSSTTRGRSADVRGARHLRVQAEVSQPRRRLRRSAAIIQRAAGVIGRPVWCGIVIDNAVVQNGTITPSPTRRGQVCSEGAVVEGATFCPTAELAGCVPRQNTVVEHGRGSPTAI